MYYHNIDTFLGYGWGCTESATVGSFRVNRETTRVGTAGIPFVKAIVSAFDTETGNECKYGQEGELCICSPGMMVGYYDEPEMTAEKLRTHTDGTKWLHTGDLGTVDAEGFVRVKGRLTRMILIAHNAKIYPAAIENAISQINGVKEVVFCAIPNKNGDGFFTPVCYIVPNNMAEAETVKDAVEQFCQLKYAENCRPKCIFFKEQLPLNKGNKPDILALEKEAEIAMAK